MIVASESTQYHITLRSPVAVKLSGSPVLVSCFDATLVAGDVAQLDAQEFRVVKVWAVGDGGLIDHKIAVTLFVPADNIAGLVAQPFSPK